MNNPTVTVIVVCYNHAQYLEECIQSITNQTYKNIELIVADDFSEDGSVELCKQLNQKFNFTFLPNEKNIGLNNTLIGAIMHATGSYISIIAADDYMHIDKIIKQINYLINNGKDGVYATGFSVSNDKKEYIKLNPVFLQNNNKKILNYIYQCDWGAPLLQSGLFSKKIVNDLLPLRKQYKSDDWAFLIKAFEMYDIGYINEPLFYYRLHPTNTHKKYWTTFPMRVDIVCNLIPDQYRIKALSNIMLSQGQYLMADNKFFDAIKFFLNSLILNFSFNNTLLMFKSTAFVIKRTFLDKNSK